MSLVGYIMKSKNDLPHIIHKMSERTISGTRILWFHPIYDDGIMKAASSRGVG